MTQQLSVKELWLLNIKMLEQINQTQKQLQISTKVLQRNIREIQEMDKPFKRNQMKLSTNKVEKNNTNKKINKNAESIQKSQNPWRWISGIFEKFLCRSQSHQQQSQQSISKCSRQRFDSCRVKSYNKKLYQSHSLFNQSQFSSKANLKSRKKINDHRLAVFQKLYCTLFIVYSKRVSSQQASFLLIFLFQWEESYEGRQQWMICSYGDTKGLRFVSNLLLIVLHFASRRECNQKPSSKTIQIGFNQQFSEDWKSKKYLMRFVAHIKNYIQIVFMNFFDYNYFMTQQPSTKELLFIIREMQQESKQTRQELIETRGKLEQMMKQNGEESNKMYGAIETNQKTIDANLKAIEDTKGDIKQMIKKEREEFKQMMKQNREESNRMYAKLQTNQKSIQANTKDIQRQKKSLLGIWRFIKGLFGMRQQRQQQDSLLLEKSIPIFITNRAQTEEETGFLLPSYQVVATHQISQLNQSQVSVNTLNAVNPLNVVTGANLTKKQVNNKDKLSNTNLQKMRETNSPNKIQECQNLNKDQIVNSNITYNIVSKKIQNSSCKNKINSKTNFDSQFQKNK